MYVKNCRAHSSLSTSDTPHPLCRVGYIKSLVLGAEDRHHGPVVLLQVQDELLLSGVEHVDTLEALKDPSRRRSLGRIPFLIGVGAASLFQALPDAPL